MTTGRQPLRRMRGRDRSHAWLAVFLTVTLSACSSGDSPESGSSSTRPNESTSSTSTTIDPAEMEVLAAYRAYWDAYIAASNPMNPADPRLPALATGRELEQVTRRFLERRRKGEIFKGSIDLRPTKVKIDGDEATLEDCSLDGLGVYDAKDPTVLKEPPDTERRRERVVMRRVDGAWKVAEVEGLPGTCKPEA